MPMLSKPDATSGLPRFLPTGTRLHVGDAIEHPAGIVRCGEERGIADRRPHEAPEPVVETGDRVPGRRGRAVDAEAQPAVPRKVLELHGADEEWRIEACERVETDVLDPVGKFGAEKLP